MLEKFFKLKDNKTTVKTEIIAGLTTFMTMAYIIALNPNLLTNFGTSGTPALWNGVFMATCIASAVGMFAMAFLANKPFAMAPGMGLNSFFAIVVANIVAITTHIAVQIAVNVLHHGTRMAGVIPMIVSNNVRWLIITVTHLANHKPVKCLL